MKNIALLGGATAILAALSVPAFAQTEISTGANATGVSEVDDRITDISDAVEDNFDRSADSDRFGPADRRQGLGGNMSLSYSGTDGSTDTQDLAIAGRVHYNADPFAQSVGLAIEFGENEDGTKDQEDVSAIYDAQYYFNDKFYAFALGRLEIDGLADGRLNSDDRFRDASEDGDLRRDAFIGVGPGYRVINTDTTAWRVQAGVGYRYTQTAFQYLADQQGWGAAEGYNGDDSDSEVAYIVSSRAYHRFNDNLFLTNDTDILSSDEAGESITNELGLNFKMSEQLATRVSYKTEYESERTPRTDNTLGVAVVYGF